MESKNEIRTEYRRERDILLETQARAWAGAVNEHLTGWDLFQKADRICFYYPLGKEVDLLPSASLALSLGKKVYFPRTQGLQMEFYRVTDLTDFREGNFHVMEPVGGSRLEPVAETVSFFQDSYRQKDGGIFKGSLLILVPGVAFDRQKQRLGYGKGYYDGYLAGIPGAVKAGIAYGCQITERIPADRRDIPMDYMITEAGIW